MVKKVTTLLCILGIYSSSKDTRRPYALAAVVDVKDAFQTGLLLLGTFIKQYILQSSMVGINTPISFR